MTAEAVRVRMYRSVFVCNKHINKKGSSTVWDFGQRLANWFGGKGWINDEEKRRKEQQSTPVAPQAPQSTKAVQFNQPKPLQQPSLLQNRQGFERQLQPKPLQTASQVANTTAMETQRHPRLQWDAPKPKPNPVTNQYRQSQDMFKTSAQKQMESITQRQSQDSQEDAQFRQNLTARAMANRGNRTDQQIHESVDRAVQANRQARAAQRTAEASKRTADFVGAITAPARAARSMVYKPIERALEGYEKAVDSTDKEAGHQWTSLGDYLRFITKLPSGMVRGVTGGGEKIGQAITGYKINQDDTTQKINNAQRAGYLIDGLIDTAGVLTGGSGTAVRSLTKQGLKQAASRGGRQIVGHIAKDAGKEGLEELVQHGAGDLADDGKINNDARSYRDAFLLGGLGGGVMSGTGHGVQAVRNAYRGRTNAPVQHNPYREADKASAKLADLERDAARQMQFNRHNASLLLKDAEFNQGAVQRLAKGLEHGTAEDIAFIRMRPELLKEVNAIRVNKGLAPLSTNEVVAYKNAVNNHLRNRVNEGMSPATVAYTAADSLINPESRAYPGTTSREGFNRDHIQMVASENAVGNHDYNTSTITESPDGRISLKNITPRSAAEIKKAQALPGAPLAPHQPAGIGIPDGLGRKTEAQGVLRDNIAKTGENVNTDLHQAYKQYGDTFYDHLTDEQQLRYETMLDDAPRDAQGRYTDPITGEQWIAEVVDYDGKKAVRTEYQAADINDRMKIREDILAKFGGKPISLNEIHEEAGITQKSAGKLAGKSYSEQPLDHVNAKINSAMHIDELGLTMTNVRVEGNTKNSQKNAPQYIKGDTIIINDGRAYEATFVIKHHLDGRNIIYDVVIQKEIAAPHAPMRNSAPEPPVPHPGSQSEQQRVNSSDPELNVAKTGENVKSQPGKQMELGLDNGRPLEWQDNGLQQTMRKSRQVNARVKKAMQQEQHIVMKDATADEIAQEFVKNTPIKNLGDATIAMLDDPSSVGSKVAYRNALKAMDTLAATGDALQIEKAARIAEKMSRSATENGQALQALAVLARQNPETMHFSGMSDLRRAGVEITPAIAKNMKAKITAAKRAQKALKSAEAAYDTVVASERKLEGRWEAESAKLQQLNNEYKTMKKNRASGEALRRLANDILLQHQVVKDAERSMLLARANNTSKTVIKRAEARRLAEERVRYAAADYYTYIASLKPGDAADGFTAFLKANMLSGVKTHMGNALSNITLGTLDRASGLVATAVDKATGYFFTGERSRSSTMRGTLKGAIQGAKKAGQFMKTGVDELGGANKFDGTGGIQGEHHYKGEFIDKTLGNYNRFIFRAMGAGDKVFRYAEINRSLYDQAITQAKNLGLKGEQYKTFVQRMVSDPTDTMVEKAVKAGAKSVLDIDTKLASWAQNLKTQANSIESDALRFAAKTTADVVVPFVRVPTAFLSRAVDYSPAGFVKAISTVVDGKRSGMFDQRAFSEQMGQAILGTSIMAGGAALMLAGILEYTGNYPRDPKERARWEAEGIQPNSLVVTGEDGKKTYVSMNYAGVAPMVLGAARDYAEAIKRGEGGEQGLLQAALGYSKNVSGQSFVVGLNNFLELATDGKENSANKFISGTAGMLAPNAFRDAAEAIDDKQRDTGSGFNRAINTIQAKVPFWRHGLRVKQDVYGNEIERATGDGAIGALRKVADPLRVSAGRHTDVTDEVGRLHSQGQDITPPKEDAKFSFDGQDITMDDAMRYDYQKILGNNTQAMWDKMIHSEAYRNLDDEQKAEAMQKLRKDVKAITDMQFAKEHKIGRFNANHTMKDGKKPKELSEEQRRLIDAANGDSWDMPTMMGRYAEQASGGNSYTKKAAYQRPDEEYQVALREYEEAKRDNALTPLGRVQAERKLQKLKVGKDTPKETREAYEGNKSDVWAMLNQIENEGERAKAAKEILDYGDKLVAAGVEKKNKFRDKYGNIAFAPHEGGSGGGRRGGGRGRSGGATVAARSNEASKVANAAAITLSSVARNRPQLRGVQFNGRAADLRQFMRGRNAGKPRKSRAVTFY